MARSIPGCDYVVRIEDVAQKEDSIQWFTEVFGKPDVIKPFPGWKAGKLKETLKENKEERINKIIEIIEDGGPLWSVYHHAWVDSVFWFVWPEYGFGPEMGLLEDFLVEVPNEEILVITETYDYHI